MLQAFPDSGSTVPPIAPALTPVTEDQRSSLTNLLSGYDPARLTSADTAQITARISELGLQPQRALIFVVRDAADRKPVSPSSEDKPAAPAQGATKPAMDTGIVPLISDVVAEYRASDGSTSLWSMLQSALQEAGYNPSKALVDFYV